MDIKQIMTTLVKDSTSHGIPRLIKSRTPFMKLVWLVCTITSITYCIYSISMSVIDYLNYETITNFETAIEIPSLFPAITICNLNPFQTEFGLDFFEQTLAYFTLVNNAGKNSLNFDDVEIRLLILNKLSALDDSLKKKLALSDDLAVIKCAFSSKKCNSTDFEWYFDVYYGNCLRFNTGKDYFGNKINLREITQAGDTFGLRLQIFLGDTTKIPGAFTRNGLQVMVNNQSSLPSFNEGITAEAGTETNIRISRVFNNRLGKPFNDCLLDSTLDAYDSELYRVIVRSNRSYRQKDCFMLCLQEQIIKICGCYFNGLDKLNGKTMCSSLEQLGCAFGFPKDKFTDLCIKYCPLECNFITYSLSSTSSQFPSRNYAIKLINETKIGNFLSNRSLDNDVLNSFVALNIYYDEMSYLSIEEQPKEQLIDLISNIGGLFGLFMGISCLSFVELFEMLTEILCWLLLNDQNRVKTFN